MKSIDIIKLRKELKRNQTDFAEELGISQPYLSEIERGLKPITKEIEVILYTLSY